MSAHDQMERLLALVPYLNGKEIPVEQVAATFGLPVQRIIDDLNLLWMCGLPGNSPGDLIEYDFEALLEDGDQVVRVSNADFLPRPLRLTTTEAAALAVALRILAESSSPQTRSVVERTLRKLDDAMGPGAHLGHVVDVPSHAKAAAKSRSALAGAVQDLRQVELSYLVPTRDQPTLRVVDPIALHDDDGHTYLEAWCHLAEGYRLFRLDRIDSYTVLASQAKRHRTPRRDLSEGIFQPGPDSLDATIEVTREAVWVSEYYPVEEVVALADGGQRITLKVSDPLWLTRLVLRLSPYAVVISPPTLGEDVRAAARSALANYS